MIERRSGSFQSSEVRVRRRTRSKSRWGGVQIWFRRHGWKLGVGVIAVVVLVQVVYPTGRSLPFAKVGSKAAGMQTRDEIEKTLLQKFSTLHPEIRVDGQTIARSNLEQLGAKLDATSSSDAVFTYPWWQRVVPFSLLVLRPDANQLDVQFDTKKLTQALEDKKDTLQSEPRNATVEIQEGKAKIVEQKPGVSIDRASLKRSIETAQYFASHAVVLEPKGSTAPAARTKEDESVQVAYERAVQALRTPLVLSYGDGEETKVDAKTFGNWLAAVEQEDQTIQLGYDEGRIATHLEDAYAKQVTTPAGVTKITTVDGVETAREPGAAGTAIDHSASAASIGEGLLGGGEHRASVQLQPVAPREEFNRQYTPTPRGVAAYIRDTGESGQITIALAAPGVAAEAKSNQMVTAASTYKMFAAVMVLHKIDNGDIKDGDEIAGSTVSSCIDKMIVQSDNPCAEAFIQKLGRREINEFFHSRGYSQGTTFTHAQSSKTTAADLVKLLQDIESAKDIKPDSRDRLLSLMKRQQFRQGIPAGSGASVSDKVGFLGAVLNDAGTVYHPRGTYHIAIMTEGQSWQKIAEITKKIESLLYP